MCVFFSLIFLSFSFYGIDMGFHSDSVLFARITVKRKWFTNRMTYMTTRSGYNVHACVNTNANDAVHSVMLLIQFDTVHIHSAPSLQNLYTLAKKCDGFFFFYFITWLFFLFCSIALIWICWQVFSCNAHNNKKRRTIFFSSQCVDQICWDIFWEFSLQIDMSCQQFKLTALGIFCAELASKQISIYCISKWYFFICLSIHIIYILFMHQHAFCLLVRLFSCSTFVFSI